MKKNLLLLGGLIALNSCATDPLDLAPISEIGANGFYTNDAEVELGTIAIYDGLQAVPKLEFTVTEMRSDNSRSKTGEGEWGEFENFAVQPTNQQVQLYWAANYNVIFRANRVLEHLDVVSDATLRNQFEGEALFARALSHYKLVNAYGDVPLLTEVIGPQDSSFFNRVSVATVMDTIIQDLATAVSLLPTKSNMAFGRATRGAAEALLAKVYLKDGNYSAAESLCTTLIDSLSGYSLLTNYSDVFYNEGNDEIIFAIPYINDDLFESQDFSFEFTNGGVRSGLNYLTTDLQAAITSGDLRGTTIENPLVDFECAKFLTSSLNARTCGNDWIVLRLADVYLMHVEAKMAGQGSTQNADAIASYNMVRARAGLPTVATDGTGEITLSELLNERRVELAFENHRFDDLTRTNQAQTVLSAFASTTGAAFSGTDLLLPIPQNEINVSEGRLSQNPGYN